MLANDSRQCKATCVSDHVAVAAVVVVAVVVAVRLFSLHANIYCSSPAMMGCRSNHIPSYTVSLTHQS